MKQRGDTKRDNKQQGSIAKQSKRARNQADCKETSAGERKYLSLGSANIAQTSSNRLRDNGTSQKPLIRGKKTDPTTRPKEKEKRPLRREKRESVINAKGTKEGERKVRSAGRGWKMRY